MPSNRATSFLAVPFVCASLVLSTAACGDATPAPADASSFHDAAGCFASGCADPLRPHCDPSTRRCVECLESTHCANPLEPVCSDGSCQPCLTNAQCRSAVDLPLCLPNGRCGACVTNADCPSETPRCDAMHGRCVECLRSEDCPDSSPACVHGACRPCAEAECSLLQARRELASLMCLFMTRNDGESEDGDALARVFCAQRASLDPYTAYLDYVVSEGLVTLDPEAMAACRRGVVAGDSSACNNVFRGTVAAGESCSGDLECESGRCIIPPRTCSGRCAPLRSEGGPCASHSDCRDLLACVDGACRRPPGEGEPCTGLCAEGLRCESRRGICVPLPAEGESCSSYGNSCRRGLVCMSGRCSPPPGLGEPCYLRWGTPLCHDGLRCHDGICAEPRPEGAACRSTSECRFGSRCHDGRCATVRNRGERCTAETPCALGLGCIDGRCRTLPDIGERCFDSGCLRGRCVDGRCTDLPLDAACEPGPHPHDIGDPCGSGSSCVDRGSGGRCTAELGADARCGGDSDAPCRSPDLICEDGYCTTVCRP